MDTERKRPLFDLGCTVATPRALLAMEKTDEDPSVFFARHESGDWGELDEEDRRTNEMDLQKGFLMSAYRLKDRTRIWIITDPGHAFSTLLLPSEY